MKIHILKSKKPLIRIRGFISKNFYMKKKPAIAGFNYLGDTLDA